MANNLKSIVNSNRKCEYCKKSPFVNVLLLVSTVGRTSQKYVAVLRNAHDRLTAQALTFLEPRALLFFA